jgi:DNA-3-methyladenine glycosylase
MFSAKYPRDFYLQDTFTVAQQILGSYLCTCIDGQLTVGKIVETEVYLGSIDKAAHSYPHKKTPRTQIQFGLGGYAYIFLVYGMYYQFCIVTGPVDVPDVVLIRALEPIAGIEYMMARRKTQQVKNLTNGPGKLCISLYITKDLYGADLLGEKIWLSPPNPSNMININQIQTAKRIGIDYAEEFADKLWRFYINDNQYVSKK